MAYFEVPSTACAECHAPELRPVPVEAGQDVGPRPGCDCAYSEAAPADDLDRRRRRKSEPPPCAA